MAAQEKPANVIVFFTDQQRWDTLGTYGNPLGLTPNLDRYASRGTVFDYAFTCQPVCGPARSVVQTGRYPTTTGCFRNGVALPQTEQTLADLMKGAGYDTAYIGKWHLADRDPVPKEQRGGYDYWLAANTLEHTSDAYRTVLFDGEGQAVSLPGYRVDALVDAGIRYVDAHREDPFFLFLSFLEPHHQNHRDDYPAPDVYRGMYQGKWGPPDLASLGGTAPQHLDGYLGMVRRLDEAFGRLLEALKSLGLDDNTIVLYTCDHGNHFKTRNSEYKRSCHESSIRIPMILGGGPFQAGGRIPELVSLVDVAPTLLDGAGISAPPSMQGRSALPLLRRDVASWPSDIFVQISESQVGRAIRTHRWKYSVAAPDRDASAISASDQYVEEFLYDLQADPYELNNLIGLSSHSEVATRLRQRLIQRVQAIEGEHPVIHAAPTRPSGQRYVAPEELNE